MTQQVAGTGEDRYAVTVDCQHADLSVTSRAWWVPKEVADAVARMLGQPSGEQIVDTDTAQRIVQAAREGGAIRYVAE